MNYICYKDVMFDVSFNFWMEQEYVENGCALISLKNIKPNL